MKQYVGLDVSQQTTHLCVIDNNGKSLAGTEPRLSRRRQSSPSHQSNCAEHIGKPKLSDAMMWRVSPDHGENDVTGKRRLLGRSKNELDFSSAIRELARGNLPYRPLCGFTSLPFLRPD